MYEYIYKAFSVWFIGFFPFMEIYVAAPAGVIMGLDPLSVIIFSVAGNFLPVLVVEYFYGLLMKFGRFKFWLEARISEKVARNINRYGFWYIVTITPWIGVWAMAIAAKILRVRSSLFIWASFISVAVYAVIIVLLMHIGVDIFTGDKQ